MTQTYGYTRVSTNEQATDRSSLEDQERRISGAAMMRGETLTRVISDPGISGAVPISDRPGGSELMAVLQRGDVVIAAKMDRMFRSARDALVTVESLRDRGVKLVLADMGTDPVTENGVSRLFFAMLAAFAEFERERIAERVAEGRAGKKRSGGHIGGSAPFGWCVRGSGRTAVLAEDEDEQAVIAAAVSYRGQGLSLRKVAKALADAGHVSRTGGSFAVVQIERMLTRTAGAA